MATYLSNALRARKKSSVAPKREEDVELQDAAIIGDGLGLG